MRREERRKQQIAIKEQVEAEYDTSSPNWEFEAMIRFETAPVLKLIHILLSQSTKGINIMCLKSNFLTIKLIPFYSDFNSFIELERKGNNLFYNVCARTLHSDSVIIFMLSGEHAEFLFHTGT